jgi:hypothetical protein
MHTSHTFSRRLRGLHKRKIGAEARMWRELSAATKARLNAYGMSMRLKAEIIGKVQEENIGNRMREMPEFGLADALDSGRG